MRRTWLQRTLFNWRFWTMRPEKYPPIPLLTVTVVVPAYNEAANLSNTLEAILAQSYNATSLIKVIVVDDCSTDATNEIASSYALRYPQISVLRPEVNSGTKAQALNLALPVVDTDIFICVDGDTILAPNAVEKALLPFGEEETGITCGFVVPQYSETVWEAGRNMEYLYAFSIIKGAQERLNTVLIASGCFTLIRTELLRECGGYDRRTMAEDMDLTWKVIEKGYNIRFVEDAICYVVDPHDRVTMHKQLSRWNSGFIQNLRVRNFNVFKHSLKLGFVAYFYFIWGIVGPFLTPLAFMMIFQNPLVGLGWFFVFYGGVIWLPSLIKAIKLKMPLRIFFKSILPLFAVSYYSVYVFMETVFKEFILNKTVSSWDKGH